MAMNNSNPVLKLLLAGVLAVVVAIIVWPSDDKPSNKDDKDIELGRSLTPDELRELGLEGDTAKDTVATLIGEVKKLQTGVAEVKQANDKLTKENKELKAKAGDVEGLVEKALARQDKAKDQEFGQLSGVVGKIEAQLSKLENVKQRGQGDDIPIGLGLEGNSLAGGSSSAPADSMVWYEPMDAVAPERGKKGPTTYPTSFSSLTSSLNELDEGNPISGSQKNLRAKLKGERDIKEAKPVYTIPENSTLMGSVAMTAMIGRVPIRGSVTDPYPFKVLIGQDNLTANGIEIPDVASAVVSGTATGDWTLSCVSGAINSITFVFHDGRVRTLPAPQGIAKGNSGSDKKSSIGWISDPYGIPCISGERKSNASQFIASQFVMGALASAGEAAAAQETTTSADSSGSSSAVTGDMGSYMLGKAGAGGMEDVRKWAMDRYGQTFDAIYVPSGQKVAIHITSELPIDYELNGRKVNYGLQQAAALDLD